MRLIGSIHIQLYELRLPPSTTFEKGTTGAELKAHASNSYNVLTRLIEQ